MTHTYQFGSRLSNAYTLGRDGKPYPKHCGPKTSSAYKAWKQGRDEFVSAQPIPRSAMRAFNNRHED